MENRFAVILDNKYDGTNEWKTALRLFWTISMMVLTNGKPLCGYFGQ